MEMLFFPVVNEACRILAEGVAIRASDLDVASVLGRGFPAYRFVPFILVHCTVVSRQCSQANCLIRGGIIFWANFIGSRYICSRLEDWSKVYGKFFEPCHYLVEHAKNEIPLVSNLLYTYYNLYGELQVILTEFCNLLVSRVSAYRRCLRLFITIIWILTGFLCLKNIVIAKLQSFVCTCKACYIQMFYWFLYID